jgi:dolichol-phosphate mannosyltransferase
MPVAMPLAALVRMPVRMVNAHARQDKAARVHYKALARVGDRFVRFVRLTSRVSVFLYSPPLMRISVVIPVCNEVDNVAPLVAEIRAALADYTPFEIIFVDDGSTDGTAAAVCAVRKNGAPEIRLLQHPHRSGQSAAVCTGVQAARSEWIATLDGDGQNDPADIPLLLRKLAESNDPSLKLIMGHRVARSDTLLRKAASRIANRVRAIVLQDHAPDTGCGIKLLHRASFLELPHFNHMHRFLPALFQRARARVMSVPVRHRPRTRGASKYGIHNRLWCGIVDLFGVRWLIVRGAPHAEISER